jgi:hypothetical protein
MKDEDSIVRRETDAAELILEQIHAQVDGFGRLVVADPRT